MITSDYLSSSHSSMSLIVFLFLLPPLLFAESSVLFSAIPKGGSSTWINNDQAITEGYKYNQADDLAYVRPILLTDFIDYNYLKLQFGCGFFCYGFPCDTGGYFFGTFIFILQMEFIEDRPTNLVVQDKQTVWSSNRDQMVQENASLTLSSKGELVLRDSDGSLVWSTNTSTHDFQSMTLQNSGNLLLFNTSNGTMWQSFDHPTDTLLLGQKLKVGQKLIANTSSTNTRQDNFYCSLSVRSLDCFIGNATQAQRYYMFPNGSDANPAPSVDISYIQFDKVSLSFHAENGSVLKTVNISQGCLYFRIDSTGRLESYSYMKSTGKYVTDFLSSLTEAIDVCDYPAACGKYGICTDGQCSCPKEDNAFDPVDYTKPSSGCRRHIPLECAHPQHFLEVKHASYFAYHYNTPSVPQSVSKDYCQNLCLISCSCEAAFFWYDNYYNFSSGHCHLESNVYSLKMNTEGDDYYNSSAYIKVQSRPTQTKSDDYIKVQSRPKQTKQLIIIIIAAFVVVVLFLFFFIWIRKNRKGRGKKGEDEDDRVDWPEGSPHRYSFRELESATNDFSTKLGCGGFGSVYEGVLSDGSKIAVKRLDGGGQGLKEFKAEVDTLGKIDHLHLVRLKGFCAEKAHRMLVYEYLPNGSLDKWIFPNKMHQHLLDWKTRYKIVLNVARGLAYLHEDCRERIIHFDIKPENILLDQDFNAKVSDFGLAKLVNREQSEVITLLRGTPGYMAPELQNLHFTEKADVFSFGVMVVEIVSGKRRRELSEDSLFTVLQAKAEEAQLIDLLYEGLEDEAVIEEAVRLLKVAMWCVHDEFTRRPAMSIVVKALEGLIETLDDVPFVSASNQQLEDALLAFEVSSVDSANPNPNRDISYVQAPSVLSGPR